MKPAVGAAGLVGEVFSSCLFASPDPSDGLDRPSPPKCKTRLARKAALSLLAELSYDCRANAEQVLRCIHSKVAARPFFGGDRKLTFPGRAAFGVTPTTDDKRRRELARKLGLPKDPAEAGVAMRLRISSLSKNRHKMVQFKTKHQLEDDDVKLMHAIASRK